MRIKKLSLENIRSYESGEVTFPEGSTLLSGDIGAGKTSILLSLEYAFFGLQPGQRGSALLSNGKETGGVSLELEINGKKVVIERKLKRKSKTVSQDYASISIDGIKQELSVTELKTKILQILNYPLEFVKKTNLLYRYTVYSPQEEMKQIILEDSESRLNVLRHVFGVDKYKRIKENLIIVNSKLRERCRILQAGTSDLEDIRSKLTNSEQTINKLLLEISNSQKDLEEKVLKRKEVEQESKNIELKIKEKQEFEKEIEKANIQLNNKTEQLSRTNSEISEIERIISETKIVFNKKDLEDTISLIIKSKNTMDEFNKERIELSGKINSINLKKQEDLEKKNRIFKIDICPTCLQDVSEGHKHNILNDTEKQLSNSEKIKSHLEEELQKNFILLSKEKQNLEKLEEKKSELDILKVKTEQINYSRGKLKELISLKEFLKKDSTFLQDHIITLKKSVLEFSKFDNIFRIKSEELKSALLSEKNLEIRIAEFKKEKEMTDVEVHNLKNTIKEKEESRDKLVRITKIEKWLSTEFTNLISFTEKNIMLKLREEFSKSFNKWFTMLTSDNFSTQLDENFTPVVMQGGYELDYAYLSGGERTAIALAYRLALNQIINSVFSNINTKGLVVLDEPTDGFSDQQLDKIRDILQELNTEQLILVSHEQKIEGFVDNVIKLKKESGKSSIVLSD